MFTISNQSPIRFDWKEEKNPSIGSGPLAAFELTRIGLSTVVSDGCTDAAVEDNLITE